MHPKKKLTHVIALATFALCASVAKGEQIKSTELLEPILTCVAKNSDNSQAQETRGAFMRDSSEAVLRADIATLNFYSNEVTTSLNINAELRRKNSNLQLSIQTDESSYSTSKMDLLQLAGDILSECGKKHGFFNEHSEVNEHGELITDFCPVEFKDYREKYADYSASFKSQKKTSAIKISKVVVGEAYNLTTKSGLSISCKMTLQPLLEQ